MYLGRGASTIQYGMTFYGHATVWKASLWHNVRYSTNMFTVQGSYTTRSIIVGRHNWYNIKTFSKWASLVNRLYCTGYYICYVGAILKMNPYISIRLEGFKREELTTRSLNIQLSCLYTEGFRERIWLNVPQNVQLKCQYTSFWYIICAPSNVWYLFFTQKCT